MMLRELRKLWKDGSIMAEVMRLLAKMVADAGYVYNHAWEVCKGQALGNALEGDVKAHDKAVNAGERQVRRMLVEHLSINPGKDACGCLAAMVMGKDIERLGDQARNIFDVGSRLQAPVNEFALFPRLDRVQRAVGEQFPKLERALRDSDSETAHEILQRYQEIKKDAKAAQAALYETELAGSEAVDATLLCLFLTRTNAHIGNAASGVVFPLENIDFVSRGLREEKSAR